MATAANAGRCLSAGLPQASASNAALPSIHQGPHQPHPPVANPHTGTPPRMQVPVVPIATLTDMIEFLETSQPDQAARLRAHKLAHGVA